MSCEIPKETLSRKELLQIKSDLYVEGLENDYGPAKTIDSWGENEKSLFVPFSYFKKKFKSPNKRDFPRTSYNFKGNFKNEEQKKVFEESVESIKTNKTAFLSLHTGFGKTFTAIKLAHKIKLKTAVLLHREILTTQWIDSINKFTTASTKIVNTSGEIGNEDFSIFNIAYISKSRDKAAKKWLKKEITDEYSSIGLLIVDEAHIACAEEMAKALQYFSPRIMIGLSATPFRKDGLDKILNLYFGDHKIERISASPFTVYKLLTNIKPEFTTNFRGKKDWNSVIDYLTKSKKRNQLIVDIVKRFPDKTIMIMSKRKTHCDLIATLLKNESVTVMKGNDKNYDKKARILISTFSKLGVGFDDSRLDMLILGCDVVEVEQYAGRLRHSEGKERIIVDLVDDDYNCLSHWRTRRKWYLSRNGVIKNYPFEFLIDSSQPRKRLAVKL